MQPQGQAAWRAYHPRYATDSALHLPLASGSFKTVGQKNETRRQRIIVSLGGKVSHSERLIRSWQTRREKYGQTGWATDRQKPSDRLTDDDYKERLKSKCIVAENGCWEYQGFKRKPPRNYGDMSYRSKNWHTHQLAYTLWKGPIPKGLHVLHSCDNPPCCNPDHLKLGTHLENMAECRAKGRYYYANLTRCKRGHEFNDENTYYIKTPGPSFGLRACRVCQRLRQREKYQQNREFHNARNREYRRKRKSLSAEGSGSTVSEKP